MKNAIQQPIEIYEIYGTHTTEAKEMTELIKSKECPKCGSEKIQCKDDNFSCSDCGLSFSCFGGQNE